MVSRQQAGQPAEPVIVEYARSFFPILLIVLVIRSFLFEPFRIPSSSMLPTLLVGDFIFVSKFSYGLRLPVTNTLVLDTGSPQRGDVAVFRLPSDPATNYIKRLVGMPGDTVIWRNKQLFINGEPVTMEPLGRFMGPEQPGALLAREMLGPVQHQVLLMSNMRGGEGTFVVPDGHYFMMGDNRDNSRDSRFAEVGYIPEELMVGRAVRIWMNWDFRSMPQWRRIGQRIQ
ncbi:MAG: signal peptidase I [Chromatiales bacterium]|nr:signal peptidase I [Chromatiales bacterium]